MDRYSLPANCTLPLPELQAEHQALIDILNWGLDTITTVSEPSAELFLSLLEDLRLLLGVHFAHEEQVMTRCRFPHLPPHAHHHDLCLARLERLGELLLEGRLKANKFLLDELYDMLLDDVVRADGDFKTFLEKGDVSIRTQS